jgi:hypothetical protein
MMRIPERDIEPPDPPYYEDDHWIDQEIDARKDREADNYNEDEGDE